MHASIKICFTIALFVGLPADAGMSDDAQAAFIRPPLVRVADAPYFDFVVCNRSGYTAEVAVAYLIAPGASAFNVAGWIEVGSACKQIAVPLARGNFYYYAFVTDGNEVKGVYAGNAVNLCVQFPGPFDRRVVDGAQCQENEVLVGFNRRFVDAATFTWTLNP
jgi:uncharacterized membrane protein